jgi:hypothetical protein
MKASGISFDSRRANMLQLSDYRVAMVVYTRQDNLVSGCIILRSNCAMFYALRCLRYNWTSFKTTSDVIEVSVGILPDT